VPISKRSQCPSACLNDGRFIEAHQVSVEKTPDGP
jgi:hypothetical protein